MVTGDGEVDTLLQATLRKKNCKDEELRRAKQKSANYTSFCRADRAHPACDCEITEEREWRERKASWVSRFLYGIVCWR